jgi:thiamine-monophosphate kinase
LESFLKISDLGELGWIERLATVVGQGGEGVACGVGDDAAVLEGREGMLLVATCDTQIEGVHFLSGAIEPRQLGVRAAAISLSDVAAMGALPRWVLASFALPADTEVSLVDAVSAGLVAEIERVGAKLVGGNTARSPGALAIDVFVLGEVERDRVLLRSGVEPGDLLCVTGDLGGSRAGLALLEHGDAACAAEARAAVVGRHLRPRARIAEGRVLAASGAVKACIDVSDGLAADAGHLADRSGVSIGLKTAKLPIAAATTVAAGAIELDPIELALSGGEDFELLFAVEPAARQQVFDALESECGTAATVVGQAAAGSPEVLVDRGNGPEPVTDGGFDHFRR